MLRKLLACLALLTGLAAAGAPAQAEVAVALGSRIEASASGAAVASGAVAAAETRPAPCGRVGVAEAARPVPDLASAIPAVLLGSDRARE